jgi:hypothetical protein
MIKHGEDAEIKITETIRLWWRITRRIDMILDDIIAAIVAGRVHCLTEELSRGVLCSENCGLFKHVIALKGGLGRKKQRSDNDKLHSYPMSMREYYRTENTSEGFDDAGGYLFLTMPVLERSAATICWQAA